MARGYHCIGRGVGDYYKPKCKIKKYKPAKKVEADKVLNSSAWVKSRLMFLREYPMCGERHEQAYASDFVGCKRGATLVHHAIDRQDRIDLALDWLNFISACQSCHSAYTLGKMNKENSD